MSRLVECVPNFSEGRDARRVDAILEAIRSAGVTVLDREMDADHNRSVLTFVGEPDAVIEGALAGVGKAAELIDLTKHSGAHPRVGATDVVPFIPICEMTIDDCVAIARRVGEAIWERFRIPVYFYEAAAQRPERVNLENIRRGQFEGLREEVAVNPERAPDVGERKLHATAGATVVGARKFLIAYNVNLNTPDVEIAKKIARTVRFSSGGLRYVKGMGVKLKERNLAQVSMNLTDFEQTPMHVAFEAVKREAARYGVNIAGSEIVGLLPKRAIEMSADYFLQLENFHPGQILENRMADALAGKPLESGPGKFATACRPFLRAVSEATATPGGGSVSALAGALAAALGQMVAGLSRRKKAFAAKAPQLVESVMRLEKLAERLTDAIDRDAQSYELVVKANRLPKETPAERLSREERIEQALKAAISVPLEVAEASAEVAKILAELPALTSPAMVSDLKVGSLMAVGAIRGAIENVRINLAELKDAAFLAEVRSKVQRLEANLEAPAENERIEKTAHLRNAGPEVTSRKTFPGQSASKKI